MVLVGDNSTGNSDKESQEPHPRNDFDSSDEESTVEYDSSPFKIDWLDLSAYGCSMPLGISALPGCRFKSVWRKLEKDIAAICEENLEDVFVLLTRGELHKYRVPWLLNELTAVSLNVHHYPFPDGATPSIASLCKMINELRKNLLSGKKTLIQCYGGLGRSALVAVSLLLILDKNLGPDDAIQKLRDLRGPGAVQSVKQYNFIHEFREKYREYEEQSKESQRSVSR